jgi:hypothetical protein
MEKVRDYYVFDNKVVNEQKCRDDGMALLVEGKVEFVQIHFHSYMNPPAVVAPCDERCYEIKREDIGA